MYKIALVQNQSEMAHYGYADARHLLDEFEYGYVLYTARNIEELSHDLEREKFDCVMFASNAFNDKTIRSTVLQDEFKERFCKFLNDGNGCVILHQLRMAQRQLPLSFLPDPISTVLSKVREEKSVDGHLFSKKLSKNHVCLLFPNVIDLDEVEKKCRPDIGFNGLYWHYWTQVSETDWDFLIHDVDSDGYERPLIVVSKEADPWRIVISSLTLDWQKQKSFLRNLLVYAVEGRNYISMLQDSKRTNTTFDYFVECLRYQKQPFEIYDSESNIDDFMRNIEAGVHSIVVLDPFIGKQQIGDVNFSRIESLIKDGRIKLISMPRDDSLPKFCLTGRESYSLRLLYPVELRVQEELREGYIDGSFWSTVDALQALGQIEQSSSEYGLETVKFVLEEAKRDHDKSGSYDEVFGPTCALLWLRGFYLGAGHSDTKSTIRWIRHNIERFEDHERVSAYNAMAHLGFIKPSEIEEFQKILRRGITNITESGIVPYLSSALQINDKELLVPLVKQIISSGPERFWIDLDTAANFLNALLDTLEPLKDVDSTYAEDRKILESFIFKTVIYIQNSIADDSNDSYPWNNKASTSLKCIQAWLKFDRLVDLPIHEIIDTLKVASMSEQDKSSTKTALRVLEELKKEIRKHKSLIEESESKISQFTKRMKLNMYVNFALLATCWITTSIFVYGAFVGLHIPFDEIIVGAFIGSWSIHATMVSILIGLATFYLKFLGPRNREGEKR